MIIINNEEKLDGKIEDVWQLVTDLNEQTWRNHLNSSRVIDTKHYEEINDQGLKTTFVILNKIVNEVFEFNFKNDEYDGHWLAKFEVVDNNITKLHITAAFETKKKSMFAKKNFNKIVKQYFNDLQQALKKEL
ncbi:MAG: hypothetical protein LUG12_02210 [Erysipelotrichaceae bacterium]|nr:hypothetical protein [Erysipelotrichaceae bacterium]